jgi:DNA-binding NarL/FixJ family response regulator
MEPDPITIVIADDHTILRQGLVKLLEGESGLKVVGEAENGREAIEEVEALKPHVVLMDIAMPMLNGIEAMRQILKLQLETKVIVLSMHSHDRYIHELLRLGVSGYLLKSATGNDIVKAIRASLKGEIFLSPPISNKVVESYISVKRKTHREELFDKLTNREREVLQLTAEGRSTREISSILVVSPSTIKTHQSNIMEKLKMDKISQMIEFATSLGIVEAES